MVIRRQFKFWKYLSRYQFERIPIRRRYETKDVSFYTRPVPANGLLQFQRASPEKKVPETRVQRMICVKFQRTKWSAEGVRQQTPTPQRVIEWGARAQRGKTRAHESKTRARIANYIEIFEAVYRLEITSRILGARTITRPVILYRSAFV